MVQISFVSEIYGLENIQISFHAEFENNNQWKIWNPFWKFERLNFPDTFDQHSTTNNVFGFEHAWLTQETWMIADDEQMIGLISMPRFDFEETGHLY